MDSPTKPQAGDGDAADSPPLPSIEAYEGVGVMPAPATQKPRSKTKTPELSIEQQGAEDGAPPTPSPLETFDWVDFEARYESALRDADQSEREILKEAEDLSKYFRAWASAASVHDDERAAKRLQTRRRFVNLSEEKLSQKQQHYDEVVKAFESALALLRSI